MPRRLRGGGTIIEARWDMDGGGTFATPGTVRTQADGKVLIETDQVFDRPGTYFPTVRVVALNRHHYARYS